MGVRIGVLAAVFAWLSGVAGAQPAPSLITVRMAPAVASQPLDGRLLLLISKDASREPRFQISDGPTSPAGVRDRRRGLEGRRAEGLRRVRPRLSAGEPARAVPRATYTVQALLHSYETFHRADGHVVKLPMDRGEGQQWNRAPGNLYSTPRKVTLDPRRRNR